ncbi:MAG TPA: MltA domain-containing protein [Allosphingosinicella sp.]|jgi:membrane-bound lytic murein transglycosylase A
MAGGESAGQRRHEAGWRGLAVVAVLILLASCARLIPPAPQPPPSPADAVAAGVSAGPALPALAPDSALRALQAFRLSCPALMRRQDASGLTRPEDWAAACAAADAAGADADAAGFFDRTFELVRVGGGAAFATGYYEPQILGARTHVPGYDVPIYGPPADLVVQDAAIAAATGTPRRGRIENGIVVPYYERAEIEDGALAGRGLEIAWAKDSVDLFFLQIQGSGRLLLPDGSIMRIGYAAQNGRDYVGIGKLMRDRGLLQPGHLSMQDIVAWLHAYPDRGKALMRENKSYVFFRELSGPPLGALGVAVTARTSVAADPKFVPLGAPVLLQLDRPEANGLWVAQDTGGAIKGPNRFDTFWGAGDEAARIAGGMSGRGSAWILVPKGTLAKLGAPPQP